MNRCYVISGKVPLSNVTHLILEGLRSTAKQHSRSGHRFCDLLYVAKSLIAGYRTVPGRSVISIKQQSRWWRPPKPNGLAYGKRNLRRGLVKFD